MQDNNSKDVLKDGSRPQGKKPPSKQFLEQMKTIGDSVKFSGAESSRSPEKQSTTNKPINIVKKDTSNCPISNNNNKENDSEYEIIYQSSDTPNLRPRPPRGKKPPSKQFLNKMNNSEYAIKVATVSPSSKITPQNPPISSKLEPHPINKGRKSEPISKFKNLSNDKKSWEAEPRISSPHSPYTSRINNNKPQLVLSTMTTQSNDRSTPSEITPYKYTSKDSHDKSGNDKISSVQANRMLFENLEKNTTSKGYNKAPKQTDVRLTTDNFYENSEKNYTSYQMNKHQPARTVRTLDNFMENLSEKSSSSSAATTPINQIPRKSEPLKGKISTSVDNTTENDYNSIMFASLNIHEHRKNKMNKLINHAQKKKEQRPINKLNHSRRVDISEEDSSERDKISPLSRSNARRHSFSKNINVSKPSTDKMDYIDEYDSSNSDQQSNMDSSSRRHLMKSSPLVDRRKKPDNSSH